MKSQIVEKLRSIVGEDWVIEKMDQMIDYLVDETAESSCPKPNTDIVLVKPECTEEISKIMKLANEELIPVVPRGGGTGLCAAAVPTEPSVLLSLERFDKILEVDEDNMMITCEAGATLKDLLEKVDSTESLFFPLHPGDEGAQIGGLVIENAGGSRAVQHGVMRNHTKGIELVLPTGNIIEIGGKVLKNNTGYDLMHLIIGSEGTLGIITKVILRLYPRPKASATLIVSYKNRHDALNTVPLILKHGIIPLAIEYIEKDLIEKSAEHLGDRWPAEIGEAYLYIIVSGNSEEKVYSESEKIDEICRSNNAIDTFIAEKKRDQEKILKIRSNIYTSLKTETADILDVTVPPSNIGKILDDIDRISKEFKAYIPIYGHAADGNLHPHIMKEGGKAPSYLDSIRSEIYRKTIELGGVITGEHGIGKTRIKNLSKALDVNQIELLREIKKVFDPNNILNPGTVIDLDSD